MSQYTLYGWPNTASTGIRWILTELEAAGAADYAFVNVSLSTKEQKEAGFLALNPKGRVPTLVIHNTGGEDVTVTEAGAIAMLLGERHPDFPLAGPAPGAPRRPQFLETHIYVVNSLLPALRDWFYADKDQTDPAGTRAIRLLTFDRLNAIYAFVDRLLAARTYLASDDEPTVTDFLFAATLSWDGSVDRIAAQYPRLAAYAARMRARPTWKALADEEEITFTVAPWAEEYLGKLEARG